MKTMQFCRIATAATVLALGTAAYADDAMSAQRSAADEVVLSQLKTLAASPDELTGDKLFVLHTALGNMMEVESSKVILGKTSDEKVKMLAEQMIAEHGDANKQLMPIAQELGVQLPTELTAMKKAELAILQAMPADKAEKAYLAMQKEAHAKTVTSFADHAQMVKNPKLKAFTVATLPKLEAHTQHVVKVAQAKGVSGDLVAASGSMKGHDHGAGADSKTNSAGTVQPGDRGDTNNRATDNRSAGERRE
jgi:putative membrane protein